MERQDELRYNQKARRGASPEELTPLYYQWYMEMTPGKQITESCKWMAAMLNNGIDYITCVRVCGSADLFRQKKEARDGDNECVIG
jgi:hypothetical protein